MHRAEVCWIELKNSLYREFNLRWIILSMTKDPYSFSKDLTLESRGVHVVLVSLIGQPIVLSIYHLFWSAESLGGQWYSKHVFDQSILTNKGSA